MMVSTGHGLVQAQQAEDRGTVSTLRRERPLSPAERWRERDPEYHGVLQPSLLPPPRRRPQLMDLTGLDGGTQRIEDL